jgi:predicted  nucleic acid-binding Zn-ribbon protein
MVHHHIAAPQSPTPMMATLGDIAAPQSPTPIATSGDQTMEPKDTAISVDHTQDKQAAHLSEIELKLLRHAEEGKQLSKMLAVAKNQSKNAKDLQQQIDQLTNEKDLLAKGYRQLVEEISQLKEQLAMINEQANTPETQKLIDHLFIENWQLKEQKAGLEKEVEFLRHKEIHLQKEVNKTGRDGVSKDMAMAPKRYYEMEEPFGQVKKKVKREEEIAQQVQENLVEKVEGRLSENEMMIQKHYQKIKESLVEHDQQINKSITELSGETVDEQGYFTTIIVRTPHRRLYLRQYCG